MRQRRRTEITIETHRIKVIRIKNNHNTVFCNDCGAHVSAFAPAQVAALLQRDLNEVLTQINAAQIHLTGNGRIALICGKSLENK